MCYENCKDSAQERHFLTCNDNKCFCRSMSHSDSAAIPLNADANTPASSAPSTPAPVAPTSNHSSPMDSIAGLASSIHNATHSMIEGVKTELSGAGPAAAGAGATPNATTDAPAPQ